MTITLILPLLCWHTLTLDAMLSKFASELDKYTYILYLKVLYCTNYIRKAKKINEYMYMFVN